MDNDSFRLALAIVAIVLAGVDLVRTRGVALTSWAVVALGVALTTAYWPDD
jgi:hypothetical protein